MSSPTLLDRRALDSRPSEFSPDARRRVGHFQIEEKLGEGGVGAVYLGFDELLQRRVGDEKWLVLEYIEGPTLARAMDDLDFEAKLEIASGVAEAIAVAHQERIVHRDLKPENIMLPVEGGVKVLDFGLARSVGDKSSGARWAGTLLYMSPEQASHGSVREASDLFSFGLVLQELLTGQPAYPTLPFDELFPRVSRGETSPLVGLDSELTELIGRLLAFEPDSRPTARESVEALRALRQRPARLRRRRLTIIVAALLALVVLGALTSTLVARRQAARQAELAQQFTREADDIEWLLRSAYLGPPRDLRPLRRQVRERMDALRERMEQVGDVGRGPGEYALGRAAVALGDYRRAWEHLDMAWQGRARSAHGPGRGPSRRVKTRSPGPGQPAMRVSGSTGSTSFHPERTAVDRRRVTLALMSDGIPRLLDVESGREVQRPEGHTDDVTCCFLPRTAGPAAALLDGGSRDTRGRRLVWRCDVVRDVGRRVLECGEVAQYGRLG